MLPPFVDCAKIVVEQRWLIELPECRGSIVVLKMQRMDQISMDLQIIAWGQDMLKKLIHTAE